MNRSLCLYSLLEALFAAVVLSGCSQGSDRGQAEHVAQGISQTMTSSQSATSETCKLFSRADISAALGATASEGHDWNVGCEWRAGDQAVQVVMVSARYWEPLAKSAGGESLPGIGLKAFVGPWTGSVRAGALTNTHSVYVTAPNRDIAVRLLREAVQRLPPT